MNNNHKEPVISVMVLSCGRNSVNSCINSIRQTTETPYELILVDNGRKCSIIAQSLVDVYIGLKNNLGVVARNYGKLVARGKYIMCIDDDVTLCSGWDEIFLAFFAGDNDLGGIGPEGHYAYPDLSNYNKRRGIPGMYVDVLTGYCWMHRNIPEGLLPWDWYGHEGRPSTWHDETQVQFQMRKLGLRFKQTPPICRHNSQRGEISDESWIDHDDKVERIKDEFKDLHLEKMY